MMFLYLIWLQSFFLLYSIIPGLTFTVQTHHTPIFSFLPHLKLHDTILLSCNTDLYVDIMHDVYIVDFSPTKEINYIDAIKLCLGLSVSGIVRIVYFDTLHKDNITEEWYRKKSDHCFIDPIIPCAKGVNFIREWNTTFHLYNNNCKHFSRSFLQMVVHE